MTDVFIFEPNKDFLADNIAMLLHGCGFDQWEYAWIPRTSIPHLCEKQSLLNYACISNKTILSHSCYRLPTYIGHC